MVRITLKCRQGGNEQVLTFTSMAEADGFVKGTSCAIIGWRHL